MKWLENIFDKVLFYRTRCNLYRDVTGLTALFIFVESLSSVFPLTIDSGGLINAITSPGFNPCDTMASFEEESPVIIWRISYLFFLLFTYTTLRESSS